MSILDEIQNEIPEAKQPKIEEMKRFFDEDVWTDLEKAFANQEYTTSAIHRAIVKRGFQVGENTLRKYRKNTYGI
jgi:hypothetical protein